MSYVLFFFLGASFGSFTLVIVNRLHVASIIRGRSKCLACAKTLAWYELIPVVSYLLQKGKCTACNTSYGREHVVVEIVYGLLFVLLYTLFLEGKGINLTSAWWTVYYSTMFVVSGVLVLYDIRHKVVPEYFLYGFIALGFIMMCIRFYDTHNLLELLTPFVISLPAYLIYILTKKRGIGLGDVILFSGTGMFLGIEGAITALIISVWVAALTGIFLQLSDNKTYTMKYALPFVPFMIFSMYFVLFTDISLWTLIGVFS